MTLTSSDPPLVYIVILNWNGWRDTLHCLETLHTLDYPRYAIVVVDNGSTDGSEQRIREAHPELQLIQTGANLGFAGGSNIGIRHALHHRAHYVWLLNNDTEVPSDCLTAMVSLMERVPALGILGPSVYNPATGEAEPVSAFPPGLQRPSPAAARRELAPCLPNLDLNDTAPGCCTLVRREVLGQLGGYDERYFHFFEDTDLCWRAWAAGWLVARANSCRIYHKYAASTNASRPLVLYYMLRNILLFSSRVIGDPVSVVMLRRPLLWMWALGPLFGLRSFRHPSVKLAVLRALVHAVRGREGRCSTYSPP